MRRYGSLVKITPLDRSTPLHCYCTFFRCLPGGACVLDPPRVRGATDPIVTFMFYAFVVIFAERMVSIISNLATTSL